MSLPLRRRTVLKSIVVAAAGTALGCHDEPGEDGTWFFPQSVASGDPRPESVVLWTRAVDPERPWAEVPLTLQVARQPSFRELVLELELRATADEDHTVRVKVTGLLPRTHYYYRFLYERRGRHFSSRVGRTRTAPPPSLDVPVRFVVGSCQNFIGRYYNSWQRLLQLDEDLDFVVFLGDYIYETTPELWPPVGGGERTVRFRDPSSALVVSTAEGPVLAAASLSNYRDIYRTVRSAPFLQQAHERYPFVAVWDDHEFSDDCWDAHATYTAGRDEELQVERRRNAELAFFEYMPLDVTDAPPGPIDAGDLPRYPDTRLWRDLVFGRNVRLLVTDYRTHRPDHLIPEDAYPAAVAMDAAVLASLGLTEAFAADLFAYANIDAPEHAQQKLVLTVAYVRLAVQAGVALPEALARAGAAVRGNLALAYVNPVLVAAGFAPIDPAGQPRGLAFVHMGKRDLFSLVGSRYVVVKDTFDVYAAWRYAVTGGAAQNAYGALQRAWLLEAARGSEAWKVVVSSVSPTSMVLDLRDKPDVPPEVRSRFYLDVDQWDGFPDERRVLLGELRARAPEGLLLVAGDIHASFASAPEGVPALTAPAISSASIQEEVAETAIAAGFPPGSAVYRYVVTELEDTLRQGNPDIALVDTDSHGFTVVEARPGEVLAAYHLIPSSEVGTDYSERPRELARRFTRRDLRIQGGTISETGAPRQRDPVLVPLASGG